MADPLSIAASVTGLIAVAWKVSTIISDFIATVNDAPASAQSALATVREMRIVLTSIGQVLDDLSNLAAERRKLISLENLVFIFGTSIESFSRLEAIVTPVVNVDNSVSKWDRIKWLSEESKIMKFVQQLESRKASLALILGILQCESSSEARRSFSHLQGMMLKLMEQNKTLTRRIDQCNLLIGTDNASTRFFEDDRSTILAKDVQGECSGSDDPWPVISTIKNTTGEENTETRDTAAHARFSQVGRTPGVVSPREQVRRLPISSFSRPFVNNKPNTAVSHSTSFPSGTSVDVTFTLALDENKNDDAIIVRSKTGNGEDMEVRRPHERIGGDDELAHAHESAIAPDQEDGYWIPQAEPGGTLFYVNVLTGASSMSLPIESSTSVAIAAGRKIIPLRDFELALENSNVYRRIHSNETDVSFRSSVVRSHTWSMLSLNDISVVSVVAMPISLEEINSIAPQLTFANIISANQEQVSKGAGLESASQPSSRGLQIPKRPFWRIRTGGRSFPQRDGGQSTRARITKPPAASRIIRDSSLVHGKMTLYKLVVLGDGGVDKSALVNKFCLNFFVETYDPTIEDSYRKQAVIDSKACMLEVLDTTGQEEYTALRDQWVRDGEGFLLVYSITSRSSFSRIEKFHQQVQRVKNDQAESSYHVAPSLLSPDVTHRTGPWPIMLIGNNCDRVTERQVSTLEGITLAKKLCCQFEETSPKYGTNVEKAFFDLVRTIRHQKFREGLHTIGLV